MFMKSEKPKIIEIIAKLPNVIRSCETREQLIVAQRYMHLAFKKYNQSRFLRILGTKFYMDKAKKINAPVVERHTR